MTSPWDGLTIEMSDCEETILREIAEPLFKRLDVAQSYALALRSSERDHINWRKINEAIVARWSFSALDYIKRLAHSGNCFGLGPLQHSGEQPKKAGKR